MSELLKVLCDEKARKVGVEKRYAWFVELVRPGGRMSHSTFYAFAIQQLTSSIYKVFLLLYNETYN